MVWVLLLATLSGDITIAEFKTEEACQKVAKVAVVLGGENKTTSIAYSRCVPVEDE